MDHKGWLEEGGIENPTHAETIAEECQQKRIEWLCKQTVGDRILELGCNWGYILDAVCRYGKICFGLGVDINPANITKALEEFPDRYFIRRDITDPSMMSVFKDRSFNTVLVPDVLEHLSEEAALLVVDEALRIASDKVLITLPLEEKKKHCFKHKWMVGEEMLDKIIDILSDHCHDTFLLSDTDFYYIIGDIRKFYYTIDETSQVKCIKEHNRK